MLRAMTEAFSKYQDATALSFERLDRRVSRLVDRMDTMETRLPQATATGAQVSTAADDDDEVDAAFAYTEAPLQRRLDRTRQGMGSNHRRRPQHPTHDNDPYAKVKFLIPPFYGAYDAETYLDWEMTVEQKFSSHLVPDQHRVRQATSEFKDFAIIWWNELVSARAAPQTWPRLKEEMRARFVPPSYRRDLLKKLQRFDQGDMSVQEYYQELQKGMIRCGVVEDQEDQIVRFYGGLRRDIQDIVDYKEYHSIQRLFHLSMLAEKELQGRQQQQQQQQRTRCNTFTPRTSTSTKTAPSSGGRPATPSPSGTRSSSSTAPSAPSTMVENSKSTVTQGAAAKPSTSTTPTGHTSGIKCHRCHGVGHMQRDCPSKRTYIATNDGYVSASDNDDEYFLGTNHAGAGDDNDNTDEEVLDAGATKKYRTLIVHRALSAKVESDDKIQ